MFLHFQSRNCLVSPCVMRLRSLPFALNGRFFLRFLYDFWSASLDSGPQSSLLINGGRCILLQFYATLIVDILGISRRLVQAGGLSAVFARLGSQPGQRHIWLLQEAHLVLLTGCVIGLLVWGCIPNLSKSNTLQIQIVHSTFHPGGWWLVGGRFLPSYFGGQAHPRHLLRVFTPDLQGRILVVGVKHMDAAVWRFGS